MIVSVNVFTSLDGVMQGPGAPDEDVGGGFDRGGWLVPHMSTEADEVVNGWYRTADAILLGRSTFEMMRDYWSLVTDPDDLVATALNSWPKYVVSNTLTDADAAWGQTTVLRGDAIAAVSALKQRASGELQVHGSWKLARALHDAGLVDVVRLLQAPVVVGQGKQLFGTGCRPATYAVDQSETRVLANGMLAMTLTRTADGARAGAFAVTEEGARSQ